MANEGDIRPFVRYKYCTCARTKTKVIREPMVKEAYYCYLTVANEGDIRPFVRYKYCTCALRKVKNQSQLLPCDLRSDKNQSHL